MEFEELCNAISRNDPRVTGLYRTPSFPSGSGNHRRLWKALIGNSHVTYVSLNVSHGIIDDPTSPIHETTISALLQYFRTAQALHWVTLCGTTDLYVGQCLRSMAANSNITHLVLCTTAIPSNDLAFFIINAPSLEMVRMPLSVVNVIVANALRSEHTIQVIHLDVDHASLTSMDEAAICLLPSNVVIEVKIQCLSMRILELRVLHATKSSALLHLRIEDDNELGVDATKCLVNALCMSQTTTLKCLWLYCAFTTDAVEMFTSYLQQSGDGGNVLSYELAVGSCTRLFPAKLLQGSCGLRSLKYINFRENNKEALGLWRALANARSNILLSKLECVSFGKSVVNCVLESIPKLLHLRELCFPIVGRTEGYREFAFAAWKNGSIHSFTRPYGQAECTEREVLRVLQLVGERNRKLPDLLVHLSDTHVSCDRSSGTMMEMEQRGGLVSLYPSLFASAQQSPRHAPNWILIGLLHLGISSIGQ